MHTVLSKKKASAVEERERWLASATKLIDSGGHTFAVEQRVVPLDDESIEVWEVRVPSEEGELRVVRRGLHNDGAWGIEFGWDSYVALSPKRGLWWVHAMHAAVRLAEHLNQVEDDVAYG